MTNICYLYRILVDNNEEYSMIRDDYTWKWCLFYNLWRYSWVFIDEQILFWRGNILQIISASLHKNKLFIDYPKHWLKQIIVDNYNKFKCSVPKHPPSLVAVEPIKSQRQLNLLAFEEGLSMNLRHLISSGVQWNPVYYHQYQHLCLYQMCQL